MMTESISEYRAGERVQIDEKQGSARLVVSCHVDGDTALSYRMFPEEDRLTFTIGRIGSAEVTLFLTDQALELLIVALTDARDDLLTQMAKACTERHNARIG